MRFNDAPDVAAILVASAKAAFDAAPKSVGTRTRVKLPVMIPPRPGCEHTRAGEDRTRSERDQARLAMGIFGNGVNFFDRDSSRMVADHPNQLKRPLLSRHRA
jgi:hypothetical protein